MQQVGIGEQRILVILPLDMVLRVCWSIPCIGVAGCDEVLWLFYHVGSFYCTQFCTRRLRTQACVQLFELSEPPRVRFSVLKKPKLVPGLWPLFLWAGSIVIHDGRPRGPDGPKLNPSHNNMMMSFPVKVQGFFCDTRSLPSPRRA